jgi:aspartate/methionine/tyrosine aminotransferase
VLFEQGQPFVEGMVARVRANLDYALEQFRSSARIHTQAPDGGYYLFPEVAVDEDEEALVLRLLEAGLNVHPGYFYGYEQGTHLMLSALTAPEPFRQGVDRLIAELERL